MADNQIHAGKLQADNLQGHEHATGAAVSAVKTAAKGQNGPPTTDTAPQGVGSGGHTIQETEGHGLPGVGRGPQNVSSADYLEVQCGPLLNYKRMSEELSGDPLWHGSVLIVTDPGRVHPELILRYVGAVNGQNQEAPRDTSFQGQKLYADPKKEFWRFVINLPFLAHEARWAYEMPKLQYKKDSTQVPAQQFVVPSKMQSMRIMFHSCNGFSVGTDVEYWNGPALWNDVLRMHEQRPFHVMIGGGDQIYNDGVRVNGPLKEWTNISNPKKRREYPFPETMRADCDEYYYKNYVDWYGSEPFKQANAQIAQINIWDDHDIIDGFGSYTDHFMRCAVFRGIGGVAHKYYLLFQHHVAPPKSTFTTDAAPTTDMSGHKSMPADPKQLQETFVAVEKSEDPSFVIGGKPGPYVEERSRSIYCQLGARVAFAGIDARTERTRHQINYPETYDLLFGRVNQALQANPNIKHLILLLGVPIAYPRLQWLENILQSPLIGPIRFLNKRFGLAGGFFNQFDGNVDLLDDLDDHYTARQHKHERKDLILRLQRISQERNVRISILGGDVHLAAIGRFYSNPKLEVPAEKDFRYMPNIVSSAITNKPPPQAVANLLAKRNKIHHLDHDTHETLLEIFNHDPGMKNGQPNANGTKAINGNGNDIKAKTANANHATMPSRNYAIIDESHEAAEILTSTNGDTSAINGEAIGDSVKPGTLAAANGDSKFNPRHALHRGEQNAGTEHPAAGGATKTGLCGKFGLDVTLRVEISPSDRLGHTDGYGFSVPALDASAYAGQGKTW